MITRTIQTDYLSVRRYSDVYPDRLASLEGLMKKAHKRNPVFLFGGENDTVEK